MGKIDLQSIAYLWLVTGVLGLAGCTFTSSTARDTQSKLVEADKSFELLNTSIVAGVKWTADELQRDIAIKHLSRNTHTSHHLVRLKGNEKPHFHDKHDLLVHVLSGSSKIHFKSRTVNLNPGDIINIPQGVYHWAENTGTEASLVLVSFSPPFDGKDRRMAVHD